MMEAVAGPRGPWQREQYLVTSICACSYQDFALHQHTSSSNWHRHFRKIRSPMRTMTRRKRACSSSHFRALPAAINHDHRDQPSGRNRAFSGATCHRRPASRQERRVSLEPRTRRLSACPDGDSPEGIYNFAGPQSLAAQGPSSTIFSATFKPRATPASGRRRKERGILACTVVSAGVFASWLGRAILGCRHMQTHCRLWPYRRKKCCRGPRQATDPPYAVPVILSSNQLTCV